MSLLRFDSLSHVRFTPPRATFLGSRLRMTSTSVRHHCYPVTREDRRRSSCEAFRVLRHPPVLSRLRIFFSGREKFMEKFLTDRGWKMSNLKGKVLDDTRYVCVCIHGTVQWPSFQLAAFLTFGQVTSEISFRITVTSNSSITAVGWIYMGPVSHSISHSHLYIDTNFFYSVLFIALQSSILSHSTSVKYLNGYPVIPISQGNVASCLIITLMPTHCSGQFEPRFHETSSKHENESFMVSFDASCNRNVPFEKKFECPPRGGQMSSS